MDRLWRFWEHCTPDEIATLLETKHSTIRLGMRGHWGSAAWLLCFEYNFKSRQRLKSNGQIKNPYLGYGL